MSKEKRHFYIPFELKLTNELTEGDSLVFPLGWTEKTVNYQELKFDDDWNRLSSTIISDKSERVIVVGKKSAGKSSLLRFLANKCLETSKTSVLYMDCDPGQSEFITPGQVSITEVSQPLANMPSLNLLKTKPLRSSSVGTISVVDDPTVYLKNISSMVNYLDTRFDSSVDTLFVNTMGWVKDFGLVLLCDIIKLVKPTHLIEVISDDDSTDLSASKVLDTKSTIFTEEEHENIKLDYQIHRVNSLIKHGQSSKQSKANRTLMVVSYLSKIQGITYKPLSTITPFRIRLSSVFVYSASSFPVFPELIFDILNCSWVHLCRVPPETACTDIEGVRVLKTLTDNECLGAAIVRNIDYHDKCFYLLTPEPIDVLSQVNCLVRPNGMPVPEELLLNYDLTSDHLPYLS